MQSDAIHLAFCFDRNAWMQCGVSMTSLLETDKKSEYAIHLVCPPGFWRDVLIEDMSKYKNATLEFHTPVEKDFENAHTLRYWSKAMFWRLQLGNLLKNLDYVIYADNDILFNDSLRPLWSDVIKHKGTELIWGVKDNINCPSFQKWFQEEIINHIRKNHMMLSYVNSGFLVMNLAQIRKDKLYGLWKDTANRPRFFPDQDILNMTCFKRIKFLPFKYNVTNDVATCEEIVADYLKFGLFTEKEICDKPVVLHAVGSNKPWKTRREFQLIDYLFWKYAKLTSYYGILFQDYLKCDYVPE